MNRQSQILPRAKRQLYDAALWWARNRSATEADRWLTGIESAIHQLTDDPERFPLANESSKFDFPLRQMNFRVSRHPTHRVLVYAIRHLAQSDVTAVDFE